MELVLCCWACFARKSNAYIWFDYWTVCGGSLCLNRRVTQGKALEKVGLPVGNSIWLQSLPINQWTAVNFTYLLIYLLTYSLFNIFTIPATTVKAWLLSTNTFQCLAKTLLCHKPGQRRALEPKLTRLVQKLSTRPGAIIVKEPFVLSTSFIVFCKLACR